MKRLRDLIARGFVSSSGPTPEFNSFARKFKNDIEKEVLKVGGRIAKFSKGHFYCSGFIQLGDGQYVYFSISDVRFFKDYRILVRTAKNDTDYTGGQNQYIDMMSPYGFGESLIRIFKPKFAFQ